RQRAGGIACRLCGGGARDRRRADAADRRGGGARGAESGECTMTTSPFDLTGKVAIVTGGGRGLGRAMAKALAQAGATVAVASRTLVEVEETAAEIRAAGGASFALPLDATKAAECQRVIERVVASSGGL